MEANMTHPYHMHREHQVEHRRIHKILEEAPAEHKKHSHSKAFSKVTSKSAAMAHDGMACGGTASPKRYAKGGRVKKAEGGPTSPPGGNPPPRPSGDTKEIGDAFSSMMGSKSTMARRPGKAAGGAVGSFAKGGKVKHGGKKAGHQTNIAIVMPHHPAAATPMPAGPPGGPAGAMPGGPPPLPPGGPGGAPPGPGPGMPPPGGMPGMPRARGGKAYIAGEASKAANIGKWSARAHANSYARGGGLPDAGAASGVGREEKAGVRRKK
jgi:hypothetical protein